MDLSDRGNPVFEQQMGLVRGARLLYTERRLAAKAKETEYRRYLKERDRAELAEVVYGAVMGGLSANAIAEAYGTQDVRTVNRLFKEASLAHDSLEAGFGQYAYTEEDIAWSR